VLSQNWKKITNENAVPIFTRISSEFVQYDSNEAWIAVLSAVNILANGPHENISLAQQKLQINIYQAVADTGPMPRYFLYPRSFCW